ncbi:MAG: GntR family transcriptional regulator [Planctomycetaceae bacterium]
MTLTLKQHAYQIIRQRLLNGEFHPDDRLSDDALSKELGISRSPVREAISQLSTEGLVVHKPRSGVYVRQPSLEEMQELYEIREALESKAAGMAAERMREHDVKELGKLCAKMRTLAARCRQSKGHKATKSLTDQFLANDLDFHLLLLRGAGNKRMLQLVQEFKLMTRIFGHVPVQHDLGIMARSYRHHMTVYKAIERRDKQAASYWMAQHIRVAQQYVLEGLRQQTGNSDN